MAAALFNDTSPYDFGDEQQFVLDRGDEALGGFISVSIRPWTEGAERSPAPHIEAWFVDPDLRRRGNGTRLIREVEKWAQSRGFTELCSDVETSNQASLTAHFRNGFSPTLRVQYFRKPLS